MKPDIVFFGEDLPQRFHSLQLRDFSKCDLLVIMGTSLEVDIVYVHATSDIHSNCCMAECEDKFMSESCFGAGFPVYTQALVMLTLKLSFSLHCHATLTFV